MGDKVSEHHWEGSVERKRVKIPKAEKKDRIQGFWQNGRVRSPPYDRGGQGLAGAVSLGAAAAGAPV